MQSRPSKISELRFRQCMTQYFQSNTKLGLDMGMTHQAALDCLVNEFKSYQEESDLLAFDPSIVKNNPIILDLGCGSFPHFFKLHDYFDNFTYIGIDISSDSLIKMTNEAIQITKEKNKTFNTHFYFLPLNLFETEKVITSIKDIIQNNQVDLVLIEQPYTYQVLPLETLLNQMIGSIIPKVLNKETGVIHMQAAGFSDVLPILTCLQKNNYFIHYDTNKEDHSDLLHCMATLSQHLGPHFTKDIDLNNIEIFLKDNIRKIFTEIAKLKQ